MAVSASQHHSLCKLIISPFSLSNRNPHLLKNPNPSPNPVRGRFRRFACSSIAASTPAAPSEEKNSPSLGDSTIPDFPILNQVPAANFEFYPFSTYIERNFEELHALKCLVDLFEFYFQLIFMVVRLWKIVFTSTRINLLRIVGY